MEFRPHSSQDLPPFEDQPAYRQELKQTWNDIGGGGFVFRCSNDTWPLWQRFGNGNGSPQRCRDFDTCLGSAFRSPSEERQWQTIWVWTFPSSCRKWMQSMACLDALVLLLRPSHSRAVTSEVYTLLTSCCDDWVLQFWPGSANVRLHARPPWHYGPARNNRCFPKDSWTRWAALAYAQCGIPDS